MRRPMWDALVILISYMIVLLSMKIDFEMLGGRELPLDTA